MAGSFSGQTIVEAKNSKAKVTLKIGKKNYTKKTCQVVKGQKAPLAVKAGNITGKKKIKYVSSKTKVVSVSKKGMIRAKKKGTAKIKVTVTAGKKKVSSWMKIKVINKAKVVLVYKCGQEKLNNLYYQVKEQRRCSAWQKTKNPTLRNSSSRSWICIMPEEPRIRNWSVNMA